LRKAEKNAGREKGKENIHDDDDDEIGTYSQNNKS
jgi:hypothetical protein